MNGYLLSDYKALNDEERRAVNEAYDTLIGGDEPNKPTDESLEEDFGLLFPCRGCVPDAYVDENLNSAIRKKFAAAYNAAVRLAEKELEASGLRSFDDYDIRALIDVSTDDCTYIAVVDWREAHPVRYHKDSCKAWHFHFESLKELAEWILKARDEILRAYRENRELQLQLGRLGRDV